jgi:uncharacterized protein YegL
MRSPLLTHRLAMLHRSFRLTLSAFSLALAAGIASPAFAANKPVVEVAFVLDTTGSMDGLIEGAKKKIWSIATTIADTNPDAELRMAIIAYRDQGDDYVTKVFPLTDDIQDLYGDLLAFKAEGGGDWPESVNEALDVAVTKLEWGKGSQKPDDDSRIIFLVGDAPPHMDYKQDRKYRAVIKDARSKGIIVNAVQAGEAEDTMRVWRSIAQLGKGDYIPIPQDGGKVMSYVSPYDEEITRLQIEIDATVVPYGHRAQQDKVRGKLETRQAAPSASKLDNASYVNKKSKGRDVITGSGDLVSDLEQGRASLDKLDAKELPDDLAKLGKQERLAKINALAVQRESLGKRMAELVAKRDAFVAEKAASEGGKEGDSFDRRVEETLRSQLAR